MAIKKKEFSFDELKKKKSTTTRYKPEVFLNCGEAFLEASGLPGPVMGHINMLLGHTNTGKAQPLTSKILSPDGWKLMGNINVGDVIIGSDGETQNVIGVYPQGERPVYKITFSDGSNVECDEEHLWAVNSYNQRHSKFKIKGVGYYNPDKTYKILRTIDLMQDFNKNGNKNYRIPICEPINNFKIKNDKIIDPYTLGVILGDGFVGVGNGMPTISTKDNEIIEIIQKTKHYKSDVERNRIINGTNRTINTIYLTPETRTSLINMGLGDIRSINKFIPKEFIYNSSIDERIDLLHGLMDTDGSCDKNGVYEFSSISKELINDIVDLINTLGGVVNKIRTKQGYYKNNGKIIECSLCYRVSFNLPKNIKPFKLSRKLNRLNENCKTPIKYITNIEYLRQDICQCIKVSNLDSLYITDGFNLTHNTTALIASAIDAQKKGILPVFIITEKKWSFDHCKLMGLDCNKNPETGEWDGFFFYRDDFNYVEQVTDYINEILDDQVKGGIPYNICFFWDSVGSIPCKLTWEGKGGKQHTAGVLAEKIEMGINQRINNTRKEDTPYLDGLVICNLPWVRLPDNPFGTPKIKPKGGEAIYQVSTLVFRFGNEADGGISKIDATKNGRKIMFCSRTKITVDKNHINGLGYADSQIIVTPHGFISSDKRDDKVALEKYKKDTAEYWAGILGDANFELVEDVNFKPKVDTEDQD